MAVTSDLHLQSDVTTVLLPKHRQQHSNPFRPLHIVPILGGSERLMLGEIGGKRNGRFGAATSLCARSFIWRAGGLSACRWWMTDRLLSGAAQPASTAFATSFWRRLGGGTLFSRSPAEGMWAEGEADGASRDRLITIEVITEAVDRAWWANYRAKLQECFLQEEVLIRSYQITKL